MVVNSGTPSKLLVLYMPGASELFAGAENAARWAPVAPTLTGLVARGVSGSLALSDPPRAACNSNNELAHLLGLDVTPRREFAKAFRSIYPNLDLVVLTASPDHHVLASDVSLTSTLLSASTLTPAHLAALTTRALNVHHAALVHLPYFAPHSTAHAGWIHPPISPLEEVMLGGRRPSEIDPPPPATTVPDHYVHLVDGYLRALDLDAAHPDWMVVVVQSWDQAHLPMDYAEHIKAQYETLEATRAASTVPRPIQSDEVREAKAMRRAAPLRSLPLAVTYYHPGSTRVDDVSTPDVLDMYLHGGNKSIGAWSFLRELAFKLGTMPKYGA
ncbi:hypothetical protein H9P43_007021 [Blastocladiella emersonii ATCC 22665]|nr:hypothetical protein H9P43_007021 [Blastocladiella emersonii ATCC 22665]